MVPPQVGDNLHFRIHLHVHVPTGATYRMLKMGQQCKIHYENPQILVRGEEGVGSTVSSGADSNVKGLSGARLLCSRLPAASPAILQSCIYGEEKRLCLVVFFFTQTCLASLEMQRQGKGLVVRGELGMLMVLHSAWERQ